MHNARQRIGLGLALLALVWSACSARVVAQVGGAPSVQRPVQAVTQLFASIDLQHSTLAVQVQLPADWELQRVALLRFGTTPAAVRVVPGQADGAYRLEARARLRGPYQLVVRVRTGRQPGATRWSVATLDRTANGWQRGRTVAAQRIRLHAQPRASRGTAHPALVFSDEAAQPVALPLQDARRSGEGRASFGGAFWIRTLARDAVVLSRWTGVEGQRYPLEVVIDRAGRLRYYFSRGARHHVALTKAPVADGQWHHVAFAYADASEQLTLWLDGQPVDSLRQPMGPVARGALALGGRPEAQRAAFVGTVAALRLWSQAPTPAMIAAARWRRDTASTARRPLRGVTSLPDGVSETPVALPVPPSIRNLRAAVTDGRVRLQWQTTAAGIDAFVIERSPRGQAFNVIAQRPPDDVRVGSSARFVFYDDPPSAGVVYYRIRQRLSGQAAQTSGVLKVGVGAPAESQLAKNAQMAPMELLGNAPNPFATRTTIQYRVRRATPLTITVWSVMGRRVATLVDKKHAPGTYALTFNAQQLASGTYFLRAETPTYTATDRLSVVQ
ncbi:LamG-like jellyroll fold domain-containing protein [Salisaeta longa]|uniref:LamG-like jellyroll fold domain-containing protein n=1 Tax=Salisaeta longa TaxID=503170 RepID=UPI000411A636|nr:LamG-like jellyroll fold domain-containing protein [Salisaeta longa]